MRWGAISLQAAMAVGAEVKGPSVIQAGAGGNWNSQLGLIRFRGHFPKGGYDVHDHGRDDQKPAVTPAVR